MATAHRAPWVAKRAAEAGGSIVASVETVQMSSESGPEQQDSNNSSSSSTNIADTGKQDEVGAVTKLRMLAPWNEPRNRVYKDSSDFVNVVFAWYRKAWTKYPEEDLIRDEGVDKRGLAFVTLNCRHSATHGP